MKLSEFYKKNPHLQNKRMNELFTSEIKFIEDQFVHEFTFGEGLTEEMKKYLYKIFGFTSFKNI